MSTVIAMLRGVNVGGHNKISMADLRGLCESLGLRGVQTYIQSGNIVFRTDGKNIAGVAREIEDALERKFRFRPGVILRTTAELRDVVARNPFAKHRDINPGKLLVTFLAAAPGTEAREQVLAMKTSGEEIRISGRELYIYFPDGMGRSKVWPAVEKALKKLGTGRNWNTVNKLLEMAEKLETSG